MKTRKEIEDEKAEYVLRVEGLSDADLVDETERKCWLSAFAANNPRAPAHWQTDILYAEANRREKPWLYCRGWNRAYTSCGGTLSESEIESAKEPPQTLTPEQPLPSLQDKDR